MNAVRRAAGALLLVAVLGPACDEDPEPSDDAEGRDVPAAVDGCPDEDALVAIGETRVCTCDDGTEAEQTCLSTGEYADCQCAGGGW